MSTRFTSDAPIIKGEPRDLLIEDNRCTVVLDAGVRHTIPINSAHLAAYDLVVNSFNIVCQFVYPAGR
jgi:hypothetical protein